MKFRRFLPEVFAMSKAIPIRRTLKNSQRFGSIVTGRSRSRTSASNAAQKIPILAAVGLQFEVVQYRLQVNTAPSPAWNRPIGNLILLGLRLAVDQNINRQYSSHRSRFVYNEEGRSGILFTGDWGLKYFQEKNLYSTAFRISGQQRKMNGASFIFETMTRYSIRYD